MSAKLSLIIPSPFITALSLLAIVALGAACGSSSAGTHGSGAAGSGGLSSAGGASASPDTEGEAGAAVCPYYMGAPVVGPGPGGGCQSGSCFSCIQPVEGMSFVTGAFTTTDDSGVTTANVRTEPGAVCVSGENVSYAVLELAVGRPDTVVAADGSKGKLFDAAAFGVTQLEFTIETPPSTGVVPALVTEGPDMHGLGFDLMSNGQLVSITSSSPSPIRVSLSDYRNPDMPDASRVLAFGFTVGVAPHYDFCVRNLRFLDANNVEVPPPS
jgi:hypothetical protein